MDEASPPVYGLDIETDTAVDGFDPEVASIVAVAVADPERTVVLRGDEASLLVALAAHLRSLPAGVIATWNGTSFDLPFLAARAAHLAVDVGLDVEGRLTDLRWLGHAHVDAYRLYRGDVGRALPVSCGLKAMARLVGLVAVEVDVERLHELDDEAIERYVASDAELARALLLRRVVARVADPVSVG